MTARVDQIILKELEGQFSLVPPESGSEVYILDASHYSLVWPYCFSVFLWVGASLKENG